MSALLASNSAAPQHDGVGNAPPVVSTTEELDIMCGPLLNYKGTTTAPGRAPLWHGSVLIVTKPGQKQPQSTLKCRGHAWPEAQTNKSSESHPRSVEVVTAVKLYEDPDKTFWRFAIDLPLQEYEACWEYSLIDIRFLSGTSARTSAARTFVVPSTSQSMRIMFHSCNGFSVGTDEDAWSGPALWNDVLRVHDSKPFHVMIGGGDQIYNDSIRVKGPLKQWTEINNPHKRREYPFGEDLRAACDKFYFDNYVRWFSTEPFASANAQIPQVNIWDDHDIIDGFGSYTDHFMKCAVFRGLGGVSLKYYNLFQHHTPPPRSTFTTDAGQTMHAQPPSGSTGADPAHLKDTFVLQEKQPENSWIIGARPGPYVEERSRSLYMKLGARLAFLGVDARTERTRHQVNYPDTYDLLFKRLRAEVAASPDIRHLIVLLGVPIAYPRLAWLENVLKSPIIGPIRLLSKRFGIAGGLFNKFDGSVDLLDDLDDHYTARQHKKERKDLILRLQAIAEENNIRVSILGGDVHLAALGRFYSKPSLQIPPEQDHRYMPNIISSAITNKPPPKAVANLLARRNKIHHLDHHTDETMMNMFDKDPGNSQKTANFNKCTMPSRNYAIITEAPENGTLTNGTATTNGAVAIDQQASSGSKPAKKDGHSFLHAGEEGAGTKHVAASGVHRGTLSGGLDVSIRVEIDQHDKEGKTEGYGFSIPTLSVGKGI
ncbi:uncharacterized protein KY384_002178 [Bacidia gigantensis]|uniref:uncharacterized protein n=1 Tax=Bacidia gigantensis TaxID=2732470 RepID=UPI001D041BE4|nr:uncharacterized protein KY384_002178 [Bacidia gigantensis]KAG8533395.1 hypothetical protein KY384_002178 [Bacidia gigantensis]